MKNGKVRFMTTVSSLLLIVGTLKCSVYMAAKQPEKKDLEVMQVGTPRSRVLAEFGQPVSTEIKDGKKVDVFSFLLMTPPGAPSNPSVPSFVTFPLGQPLSPPCRSRHR